MCAACKWQEAVCPSLKVRNWMRPNRLTLTTVTHTSGFAFPVEVRGWLTSCLLYRSCHHITAHAVFHHPSCQHLSCIRLLRTLTPLIEFINDSNIPHQVWRKFLRTSLMTPPCWTCRTTRSQRSRRTTSRTLKDYM